MSCIENGCCKEVMDKINTKVQLFVKNKDTQRKLLAHLEYIQLPELTLLLILLFYNT